MTAQTSGFEKTEEVLEKELSVLCDSAFQPLVTFAKKFLDYSPASSTIKPKVDLDKTRTF